MKIYKWLLAGTCALAAPTPSFAARPIPNLAGVILDTQGAAGTSCSDVGEAGSTVTDNTRLCVHTNLTAASTDISPTSLSVFGDTTSTKQLVTAGHFDVNSLSGGGLAWAINPVANSMPGSLGGVIADEEDVNNWTCDPGNVDNMIASCPAGDLGIYLTGASPYPSQAAISISGVSTANAQWHEGVVSVGLHVVDYATFYQLNGAQYGYLDRGVHVGNSILLAGADQNPTIAVTTAAPGAIDLSGSVNTQFAIHMPTSGANSIFWNENGSNYFLGASSTGLNATAPGLSIVPPGGTYPVVITSDGNGNAKITTTLTSGAGTTEIGPNVQLDGLTTTSGSIHAGANVSSVGLSSGVALVSAAGAHVSVPDVQVGSMAGLDQFTGPDSFTIGGTAMPDTPAGWVSPAPAFNPTVNMVTAPYGSFNAGCGLCLFMSQDNITANRAGISGVDYRTGSSAMPAIGSNDAVGFYEQPQNYAAKMVLTAASYTATEVVLKTPLTAEQMSLLRTNMYLVTNSVDPTSPTGTASDGLPVNNLMEGFISGWDPAGTYITVAGWASVSGTGVANAIPSISALDTAYSTYSSPTVFIGAPTKVWGRNTYINYQTPGANPTTSLIRRFEGEEMDWRYNASKANEVDFHGLTMSFAPTGGVGPAGMTSDSYALLMNGVLPRYVVIQDSGAAPVLIDTGFYQMGSNGESTTTPNAEMFEHDAYADGANLMRLEGRVIHTGTATGWTGAEMDLGLWIDGGQGNNAGTYAGGLKFNANGTAQASVSLCGQNGCAITAQANGLPKIVNVTYSQLPACAANLEGTVAEVTDANTSTFGAAITAGGGSNHMMGRCNGTAWVVD